MAIRSFKCQKTEDFFKRGFRSRKKGWDQVREVVRRKLDMLHYAKELYDLRSPPNNRLESLKGDLKGYFSIRINDQWRIVFEWDHEPFNVFIADYH